MPTETAVAGSLWRSLAAGFEPSMTRWVLKGAWAIADQGLFGLSNFAIHLVLARLVQPGEYGAFTLAYSVFLLLGTVHTALVGDPMVVVGAGRYGDRLPAYMAVLMRSHWVLAGVTGAALVLAAAVLHLTGAHALSKALLWVGMSAPLILLFWFMRRTCYMQVDPRLAASGSILYMALLLGGLYALFQLDRLSVPSAFALMGIGSLLSAMLILWRLPFGLERRVTPGLSRQVRGDHYSYGRWGIGTGLFIAVTLYLYYMVMPASHGLEQTAALRALMNVVLPALQSIWVLSALATPRLVRVRDTAEFGTLIRRMLLVGVAGALGYWLLLGLGHVYVIRVLYGGQYAAESSLLWLVGLIPVVVVAASVSESALRSLERVDSVFIAYLMSALVAGAVGIPLMYFYGAAGALVGMLLSYGLATCVLVWSLRSSD